jgi:hypothetical protein
MQAGFVWAMCKYNDSDSPQGPAAAQTLSELVHASFILINLLPDSFVDIPPVLHTARKPISSSETREMV